MQLVVERAVQETTEKGGFLGTGKEKVRRTFILSLKLEGLTNEQRELLETYTYITKEGNRRRYIDLPLAVMDGSVYSHLADRELISGPRRVTVPQLVDGVTWKCSALLDAFVDIPKEVANQLIMDVLADMQVGELWETAAREVIEITPPEEDQ